MEHWRLTKEPLSRTQRHTCSPWSQGVRISGSCGLTLESWKLTWNPGAVNAYSGDVETHTKVLEVYSGDSGLNLELWSLTLRRGCSPWGFRGSWALDTRPGAAKLTLALLQLPLETPGIPHRTIETHPGAMEARPGVLETHQAAMWLSQEPWGLPWSHKDSPWSNKSSPCSHVNSPWNHGSSNLSHVHSPWSHGDSPWNHEGFSWSQRSQPAGMEALLGPRKLFLGPTKLSLEPLWLDLQPWSSFGNQVSSSLSYRGSLPCCEDLS